MIINGQDATNVARRQYGRMITALYVEPFGNQYWAQNVVTAWQKLEPHDDLRGVLEARIVYGLPVPRIAEIWEIPDHLISDAIRTFLNEIDGEFHDRATEELFDLW